MAGRKTTHELGAITMKRTTEYLVVADKTSKVLKSTEDYNEAKRLASLIRKSGGEVTIFKATRG